MLAAEVAAIGPVDLWRYGVLFVGVAVSWIGVPIVGGAVLAAAAVLVGDGELDVWLVVAVASAGAWTGGYVGYVIGGRAGDALTARPGRWQRQRQRALDVGERVYRRWGRFAVFLTPTWVSGALRMPRSSFLIWNALAAIVSSLVTVFGAYAIATSVLGQLSARSALVMAAVVCAAGAAWAGVRVYRRARSDFE
jgi:membrane protein DedA with SNARE-associated domain